MEYRMDNFEIYLLAIEVRKWDFDSKKINLTAFTVVDNKEFRLLFTVSIGSPADMVEELLGKIKKINKDKMNKYHNSSTYEIDFINEHFLRQKTNSYFKKILGELLGQKKNKNKTKSKKGITTLRMDVFSEGQDVSFLAQDIRFYIYVNWARKYYEREQYPQVLDPLRKALEMHPDFAIGYKWMARAFKKLRRYEESQIFYERHASVAGTTDAALELAHSYRKGNFFEKADELYTKVLKEHPDSFDAKIGNAQINYCLQKPYVKILDELYNEKPEQVKTWLRDEWNYRFISEKKTHMNPMITAKYLGIKSVFDLSHKAFKDEIPAHFNASKARLAFYKEELDNWVELLNKYHCYAEELKLHSEEIKNVKLKKVTVVTNELGIDTPVIEKPKIEIEREKEKKQPEKKKTEIPNVEDIIKAIKKDVVIERENEKELAAIIRNGNKQKISTPKSVAKNKKTAFQKEEANTDNDEQKSESSPKSSKVSAKRKTEKKKPVKKKADSKD